MIDGEPGAAVVVAEGAVEPFIGVVDPAAPPEDGEGPGGENIVPGEAGGGGGAAGGFLADGQMDFAEDLFERLDDAPGENEALPCVPCSGGEKAVGMGEVEDGGFRRPIADGGVGGEESGGGGESERAGGIGEQQALQERPGERVGENVFPLGNGRATPRAIRLSRDGRSREAWALSSSIRALSGLYAGCFLGPDFRFLATGEFEVDDAVHDFPDGASGGGRFLPVVALFSAAPRFSRCG